MSSPTDDAPTPPMRARNPGIAARLWHAPYVILPLAILFWSGNFIVGRAVHAEVPPVALAFWRWTGGLALVLCLAVPRLRRDLPVLRAQWRIVLILAALGVAAFNTLVYLGLRSTTAINALLMQSAMPLIILLCSFLLFRDRAGPAQLAGVAVSLGGVAAIASRGAPAELLGLSFNPGDALVLTAVVAYALYSALLRRRPQVHPLSFLAATFALGALILLPLYVAEHLSGWQMRPSPGSLLAIAYVAIFPGFLSYLLFNRGVELAGANRAGHFMHLMPVFGSVLAIVFLGESLQPFHLAGIALIAAGIGLAGLGARPARG